MDRCAELRQQLLDLTPDDDGETWQQRAGGLAEALWHRFSYRSAAPGLDPDSADLDRCADLEQRLLDLTPDASDAWQQRAGNLAACLFVRPGRVGGRLMSTM